MTSRAPGVLRSTMFNWSAFVAAAAVNFFISPFVVHRLGDSGYGIWVLLGSLVGYLGLLDFGVRGAVTRFVAGLHAKADHGGASVIVVGALRLFILLAVLAVGLAGALAATIEHLFNIPPELLTEARIVLLLSGTTVAVAFIGGVYGGIVAGLQRFDLDSGVEIMATALRAVAIVVALRAGYGLIGLGVVQLGVSLLRGLIAFGLVRHLYPQLVLRGVGPTGGAVRQLLTFSIFSSLIHLSSLLIYYTDSMVIGAFLPIGAITYYAIAANLSDYARQLVSAISRIVSPRASALDVAEGRSAVGKLVLSIGPAATLVTAPIALTFLLRGRRFIDLWMGPEFGPTAFPVLALLAIMVWLAGGRLIGAATLIGLNRHQGLSGAIVGEALANIGLSVALIGPYGLPGVAFGTVLPNTIVNLTFLPWFVRRHIGMPLRQFLVRVWLRPSLACAPFGLCTYAVERWIGADSLLSFFAQVVLLLPLVLLGGALLVLSGHDRRKLWSRVRHVRIPLFGADLNRAQPPNAGPRVARGD